MKNVNVAMHAFLGDFICAEPSLREICKKHQDSKIIVSTPFSKFLEWYPYEIEVRELNGPPDYRLICNGNAHLVHNVADANGLTLSDCIPNLNIPVQVSNTNPYYLICAESSTPERQWSNEKWQELIKNLDAPVIQVGKWNKVVLKEVDTSYLGKSLSPENLASLIAGSKCFITVDTGLSHFSASIKKPYIVLMDRVPIEWRSHNGFTNPIKKNNISEITVEDVLEEMFKYFSKYNQTIEDSTNK
jgi:ADP-heptose:LPS heptosyltransferase